MNIYIQRTRKLTFSSFTCWVSFSSSSHSDDSPIPSSLSIFIALSAHRCPCAVSSHQLPTRGGPPPQHFAFKRSIDPPISCALDPLEAIDNVRDVYSTRICRLAASPPRVTSSSSSSMMPSVISRFRGFENLYLSTFFLATLPIPSLKYSLTDRFHSTKAPILVKKRWTSACEHRPSFALASFIESMTLRGMMVTKVTSSSQGTAHSRVERDARCFEIVARDVGTIVVYGLSVDVAKGDGFCVGLFRT